MIQYLEILSEVLQEGTEKSPARSGMPKTISRFGITKRFDLSKGFPLVTTKQVSFKNIAHELILFLKGDCNIKYLVDNNVNIWNEDAYKWYVNFAKDNGGEEQNCIMHDNGDGTVRMLLLDEFIQRIKEVKSKINLPIYWLSDRMQEEHGCICYTLGSIGKSYPKQWRNYTGVVEYGEQVYDVDQIAEVIRRLKESPEDRYKVVCAWNPSEFKDTALPPCHILFQLNCRPLSDDERAELLENKLGRPVMEYDNVEQVHKWYTEIPLYKLDLAITQRSCDSVLGVPYNIASYALLTHIFAHLANMVPGDLIWTGNDVHIYENHITQVSEQLSRKPFNLPTLLIDKELTSIDDVKLEHFRIVGYQHHEKIEAKLSTGLR